MADRRRSVDQHRNPFDPLDGTVADTIDLHGLRADEARAAVCAFLQRVQRRQRGTLVHVITGKGRRSATGPVLKTVVRTLLRSGSLPVGAWGEDVDGGGYLIRLT